MHSKVSAKANPSVSKKRLPAAGTKKSNVYDGARLKKLSYVKSSTASLGSVSLSSSTTLQSSQNVVSPLTLSRGTESIKNCSSDIADWIKQKQLEFKTAQKLFNESRSLLEIIDFENEWKTCEENIDNHEKSLNQLERLEFINHKLPSLNKNRIILRQTDPVCLLDIPSRISKDELKQCRLSANSQTSAFSNVGTNAGKSSDWFNSAYNQTADSETSKKTCQSSNWDIFDAQLMNLKPDEHDFCLLNSLSRIERAISWNSFRKALQELKEDSTANLDFKLLLPTSISDLTDEVRCVTSLAWHPLLSEVLAVGYQVKGRTERVECWSLKNCSWPEQTFSLNRPIRNVEFCKEASALLTADTFGFGENILYLGDLREPGKEWIYCLPSNSDRLIQDFAGRSLPSKASYRIGPKGQQIKWTADDPLSNNDPFSRLYFSPDGLNCLRGNRSGLIELFSALNPGYFPISSFCFHSGPITALCWALTPQNSIFENNQENTADKIDISIVSHFFCSCSLDTTVAVWSVFQPEQPLIILQSFPCHCLLDCALFLNLGYPNGNTKLIALSNTNIYSWIFPSLNLIAAKNLAACKLPFKASSFHSLKSPIENASFTRLALNANGTQLVVGLDNGRFALYKLKFM